MFSAYLWGIETNTPPALPSNQRSFQHTYEGLKLELFGDDIKQTQCFQHTYEGLKLVISRPSFSKIEAFSAYLWGIETRTMTWWTGNWLWVFSIPMRDWNFDVPPPTARWAHVFSIPMRDWNHWQFGNRCKPTHKFSAYLWGIETRPCVCHNRIGYKFSAYLWGIETCPAKWEFGR